MIKKILFGLLLVFIAIQFIHPPKNASNDRANDIAGVFMIPDSVSQILHTSCYDCHSNNTNYPWYAHIQPVHWWLDDHIKEGKKEMNFSEFATYTAYRKFHKLEELIEMVKKEEMPLESYLIIHRDAKLSPNQKELLNSWAQAMIFQLQQSYPADSLKKPENKG